MKYAIAKNKIKKIASFTAVAMVAVILPSCSDFVNRSPISSLTTDNAYKSASDAEAALTGVYDSFSQDYYIWDDIYFGDVRSDNHYAGGDNTSYFQVEDISVSPTNDKVLSTWGSLYNAIAKANLVIAKVPAINDAVIDQGGRRDQILGEAYFLRAFHYYNLVKLYGGVPLMLDPVTSADGSETQKKQSTAIEVYEQITNDLTEAVTRLPDTYGSDASVNKARATKGAANALLAKVTAQRSDRDYTKVITYCDAVINSPAGYQLLADFNQLWDGAHYNNAESIIEVQFMPTTETNWAPSIMLPPSLTGTTWRKFITPSKDLAAAYDAESDAIRKNNTIFFENAPWIDEYWSPTINGSVAFPYRWKSAASGSSTNRQYLLRFADILLLKAEALNESGQTEAARPILNSVRTRVHLGDTPATDQASMRLAIDNERRLELAQEGQRWYDLVRLGRAETVMNALQEKNLVTDQIKDYNMEPYKQLLPIPQTERDRNPNLEQNEGYN